MLFPVREKHMCNFLQENSFLPGHPGAPSYLWGSGSGDTRITMGPKPQTVTCVAAHGTQNLAKFHRTGVFQWSISVLPVCISQVPPALAKADERCRTPHQHDVGSCYR